MSNRHLLINTCTIAFTYCTHACIWQDFFQGVVVWWGGGGGGGGGGGHFSPIKASIPCKKEPLYTHHTYTGMCNF